MQKEHRKEAERNEDVISHFINLCKTDKNKGKNKVPDFQLIEKEVRELFEKTYPN